MDNAISACKLKQRADYLVESSKRESKENELFHSAKDLATASRVTLKAAHKSNLATTNSQNKLLQVAIKATDAAGICWRKNVRKIVSDSCANLVAKMSPTKKQEIEEMLMYTFKCISDFKENTQAIVTEHTEMFLKELELDKLQLINCEQRMVHMSVELAKKEEKIANLGRALQASKEDHKDMPEVLVRLTNLFNDGYVDTKFETFLNDLVNSEGERY